MAADRPRPPPAERMTLELRDEIASAPRVPFRWVETEQERAAHYRAEGRPVQPQRHRTRYVRPGEAI